MSALALAMVLAGAGAAAPDHLQSRRPPPPAVIYRPAPPPPPSPMGPPPQRAPARISTPYFGINDYPVAAMRANEEGIVGFRLTIGRNGRVSRCLVTASSGSAALDRATCAILRERARYTPARDARGRPGRGTDSGRVSWRLPD